MTRTIDLGLVGPGQSDRDGVGRLGRRRSRHRSIGRPWLSGRAPWWWPAAALAAALALASGMAAPQVRPSSGWAPVLTVPGGDAVVTGDRLYVYRSDGPDAASGTLTAYRLTDGVEAWHRRVPAVALAAAAGVPVVVAVEPGAPGACERSGGEPTVTSTALAPETGEPLWTRTGGPAGEVAGGVLFYGPPDGPADGYEVTAIDPRSGQEVWARTLRGRLDWDRDRLASLSPDGVLTTYDLATGARLARTREVAGTAGTASDGAGTGPAGPAGADADPYPAPVVLGSQVAVADPVTGTVSAYHTDSLARQWTTTVAGTGRPQRCGELICLVTPGRLDALDRATGRRAWDAVPPAPPTGGEAAGLPGGDHLLWGTSSLGSSSLVVAAGTGRPVRELTGWTVSRRDSGTGEAAPLLFRYDAEAHATWVGRLDVATLDVSVIGSIGDTLPAWCTIESPYLWCHLEDRPGQMRLWRTG